MVWTSQGELRVLDVMLLLWIILPEEEVCLVHVVIRAAVAAVAVRVRAAVEGAVRAEAEQAVLHGGETGIARGALVGVTNTLLLLGTRLLENPLQ
jgi:hypothetical protein